MRVKDLRNIGQQLRVNHDGLLMDRNTRVLVIQLRSIGFMQSPLFKYDKSKLFFQRANLKGNLLLLLILQCWPMLQLNIFVLTYIFNQIKKLQNPTTFFFKQAQNPPYLFRKQIDQFVGKLLNKDKCPLCKNDYDSIQKIPRIMIHCGHNFCTPCLQRFNMNRRVMCPMCLKLVKQIDNIDRRPINHTIYTHAVNKQTQWPKAAERDIPQRTQLSFYLENSKESRKNPAKIDQQSGLPFCVFHNDRLQHFYCQTHKASGCRVCIEIGHAKPQCKAIDLYNVSDPQRNLNPLQARTDQAETFQSLRQGHPNKLFGLNNEDDSEDLADDSSEDNQGRRSV